MWRPYKEWFIELNRSLHPDLIGFENEGALDGLIDKIEFGILGNLGTVTEIAAWIFFDIPAYHIFLDGNKRTGEMATMLFLQQNGFKSYFDNTPDQDNPCIAPESIECQAINAAQQIGTYEDFENWIKKFIS